MAYWSFMFGKVQIIYWHFQTGNKKARVETQAVNVTLLS